MNSKKSSTLLLKYLRSIGILTGLELALTALICLIGGWWTWLDYSNGLMYFSGLFFTIGGLSLLGRNKFKNDNKYQIARTAGLEDSNKRVENENDETRKNYKFLVIMGCTGILSIALSILAGKIGGY